MTGFLLMFYSNHSFKMSSSFWAGSMWRTEQLTDECLHF